MQAPSGTSRSADRRYSAADDRKRAEWQWAYVEGWGGRGAAFNKKPRSCTVFECTDYGGEVKGDKTRTCKQHMCGGNIFCSFNVLSFSFLGMSRVE